jgi:D-3-phosphoglycerate dehydrogenase / 2-oxoglutarate reductase
MNGQFNVLIIDEVHPVLTQGLVALGMVVDYRPNITPSDIVSIIHQYQGLVVRTKLIIDTNVLSRATQLKFIGRAGAGLDNIDTAYCETHQIICFNAGEANADAVGEHTLAMLLSLSTQLQKADKEVRMGLWDRKGNTGWELKGKTVGIVGFGNTGKAVAQKLKGFGVRVIVYDKYLLNYGSADAKEVSMETIQQEADIVSFHVPLTPETYHMVNSTWIAGCKKQIVLLNLSRGKVANLNDVVDALEKNDLKAAGLDVLENENLSDLTSEELFIQQRLVKFENTVLSPHVGGWTTESFEKISRVLLQKIKELTLA